MICSAALDPHGLAKGGGSQWALVTGQVKLNFPGSAINALPLSKLLLDKGNWMGYIFTLSPNMDRAFETPPLCGLQNVEPQKSDPLRRDSKKWQVGKLFPWARHWSLKPEGSESCMQTVLAWTNAIAQLLWFLRNILTSRSLESGSSFLSLSLVIPVAMWPKLNCIFINQPTNFVIYNFIINPLQDRELYFSFHVQKSWSIYVYVRWQFTPEQMHLHKYFARPPHTPQCCNFVSSLLKSHQRV